MIDATNIALRCGAVNGLIRCSRSCDSQQQVSNSLKVDRGEMVRIIDRLEQAGMLQRAPDRSRQGVSS